MAEQTQLTFENMTDLSSEAGGSKTDVFPYNNDPVTTKNIIEQLKLISCKICDESFSSKAKLKIHKTTHLSEKPFVCPQENCDKAFKYKCELTKHQVAHSDFRPFPCPQSDCDKSFKTKALLTQHLTSHTTERIFKCQEENCGQSFARIWHLNNHTKVKHIKRENLPFKCPICHKTFLFKSGLENHSLTHEEEKAFKCTKNGCNAIYTRRDGLVQHEKSAHRNDNNDLESHCIKEEEEEGGDDDDPELTLKAWLTQQKLIYCDSNVILLDPDITLEDTEDKVMPSPEIPITCKLCKKQLISEPEVKVHVTRCWLYNKEHHSYCVPCNQDFGVKLNFREHYLTFHASEAEKAMQTLSESADLVKVEPN